MNPKFSKKLLELNEQIESTMKKIEKIRQSESAKLGINISLSDSANHTFVFEANKKQADEAFRAVSGKKYKTLTVKNKQLTFTLEALQEAVVDYVHLRSEYSEEQKTVVDKILQIVSGYYPAMETSSEIISQIDVYCSFASVIHSAPRPFCKPNMSNKAEFVLRDSRHPLLEQINQECMVNDVEMHREESRLHIITGPNMGGKSTYIR